MTAKTLSDGKGYSKLNLCRMWLKNCLENHDTCCRHIAPVENWIPTRLLDIGASEESRPLHLAIKQELPEISPKYLALSHCWGNIKLPRLMKSNIGSMHKGISLGSLPKTFQQAIEVTRELGYRYLWIDSLCIIQDSIEDWQKESALMGEVFSRADCVIAATGSRNGRGEPIALQANWGTHQSPYIAIDEDIWIEGVVNAPLNRRGWVVQERMLSPRTIHFGAGQIFWECRELNACEILPQGLLPVLPVSAKFEHRGFKNWVPPTNQQTNSNKIYQAWNHTVEIYMKSNLTDGNDKLIALSGRAKKMQVLLKDDQKKWSTYRGPSWSWVAINGAISHPSRFDLYTDYAKITHITVEPVSEDSTGQIKSRHLKLEATIKAIQISDWTSWATEQKVSGWQVFLDDESLVSESGYSDKAFFVMPLRFYRRPGPPKYATISLQGPIITPVIDSPNTFQRVGVFEIKAYDEDEYWRSINPDYGFDFTEKSRKFG